MTEIDEFLTPEEFMAHLMFRTGCTEGAAEGYFNELCDRYDYLTAEPNNIDEAIEDDR